MLLDSLPEALRGRVGAVVAACPESREVFEALVAHFADAPRKKAATGAAAVAAATATGEAAAGATQGVVVLLKLVILEVPDCLVVLPIRKKASFVYAVDLASGAPLVAVTKPGVAASEEPAAVEVAVTDFSTILYAAIVPLLLEKANMLALVLFHANGDPIIATYNADTLKGKLQERMAQGGFADLDIFLAKQLQMCGFDLELPFAKNGTGFVVEAYKGSKEGMLYFLPQHLMFGFKKPVVLIGAADVESIAYASITRNTFLLVVATVQGTKHEFGMIDQDEYERIDAYVKRRDVADQSMSEERKAVVKTKATQTGALAEAVAEAEAAGVPAGDDDDDDLEDGDFHLGVESESGSNSEDSSGEEE